MQYRSWKTLVPASIHLKIEITIGAKAIGESSRDARRRSRQSLIFRATDPFGANWKTRAARERNSRLREDPGFRLAAFHQSERHFSYGESSVRCIDTVTVEMLDLSENIRQHNFNISGLSFLNWYRNILYNTGNVNVMQRKYVKKKHVKEKLK